MIGLLVVVAVPTALVVLLVRRRRRQRLLSGTVAERPVFQSVPPTRRVASRKTERL